MKPTIPCTRCDAELSRDDASCPRCNLLCPTRTPCPLAGEELTFDPVATRRQRGWLVFGAHHALEIVRPLVIGRAPNADVVLDEPRISRRHAVVLEEDGVYRVLDLGSRNGVRLNGTAVEDERLEDGDVLGIGGYELVFTTSDPAP